MVESQAVILPWKISSNAWKSMLASRRPTDGGIEGNRRFPESLHVFAPNFRPLPGED